MKRLQPIQEGFLVALLAAYDDPHGVPKFVEDLRDDVSYVMDADKKASIWIAETELDTNLCTFLLSAEESNNLHVHNFAVQVADVIYDRAASEQLRNMLIKIRNTAIVNNRWDDSIVLSHAISWMFQMMEAVTLSRPLQQDFNGDTL